MSDAEEVQEVVADEDLEGPGGAADGSADTGADAGADAGTGTDPQAGPAQVGVEEALSRYYREGDVEAVVLLQVDTQRLDDVALKIAGLPAVEQAHLVTGDYDLVLMVRFSDYGTFQRFMVEDLMAIEEVDASETMMVVTTYKGG